MLIADRKSEQPDVNRALKENWEKYEQPNFIKNGSDFKKQFFLNKSNFYFYGNHISIFNYL